MKRRNLDRLRAAARTRAARGPRLSAAERRRRDYRMESEVLAALEAIKSGDGFRAYPRPLSDDEQRRREDAEAHLAARRDQIVETAFLLRKAGMEGDLTRDVEDAGLMPEDDGTGDWSDD